MCSQTTQGTLSHVYTTYVIHAVGFGVSDKHTQALRLPCRGSQVHGAPLHLRRPPTHVRAQAHPKPPPLHLHILAVTRTTVAPQRTESRAFTFAPRFRHALTKSTCPAAAALCKGVRPSCE